MKREVMSALTTKGSFLITVAAVLELDPMTLPRDTGNSLVGTWQLVSVKFELTDTGESMDMYGPEPLGYFILTAEGRLMVIETVTPATAKRCRRCRSLQEHAGVFRLLPRPG